MVDMHLVVFAPAFTLSLGESEAPASSIAIGTQVRIASVVCDLNNSHFNLTVDALLLMRVALSATTFRSSCQTTLCCEYLRVLVVSDKEKRRR